MLWPPKKIPAIPGRSPILPISRTRPFATTREYGRGRLRQYKNRHGRKSVRFKKKKKRARRGLLWNGAARKPVGLDRSFCIIFLCRFYGASAGTLRFTASDSITGVHFAITARPCGFSDGRVRRKGGLRPLLTSRREILYLPE